MDVKSVEKKVALAIIIVLVLILLFSIFIIIQRKTKNYLQVNELFKKGTIFYNGNYYKYNSDIDVYLLMGIDKDERVDENEYLYGAQADALILVAVNHKNKKLSMIGINRNAMVGIDWYNEENVYMGNYTQQICLSHQYNTDAYVNDNNTIKEVSELFHNMKIDNYAAIYMNAIYDFSEAVGGVTVTVAEDAEDARIGLNPGDTVTLNSQQTYKYLRKRLGTLGGAQKRLEREVQYLFACYKKINTLQGKAEILDNLLQNLENLNKILRNVRTDVTNYFELANISLTYSMEEDDIYFVKGEAILSEPRNGKTYEEFYVDDSSIQDIILNVFYNKVLY